MLLSKKAKVAKEHERQDKLMAGCGETGVYLRSCCIITNGGFFLESEGKKGDK